MKRLGQNKLGSFESKVVELEIGSEERKLDELAGAGWELVSVLPTVHLKRSGRSWGRFYFKRPKN